MAEKEGGESSDSEAYLSADEGLTGSRGSEKGALVGKLVKLDIRSRTPQQHVSALF